LDIINESFYGGKKGTEASPFFLSGGVGGDKLARTSLKRFGDRAGKLTTGWRELEKTLIRRTFG